MFSYVSFCCSTHWLVSQGFAAAFVPSMYFQAVPIVVMLVLHYYPRRSGAPRRLRPRPKPQPLPQPVTPT